MVIHQCISHGALPLHQLWSTSDLSLCLPVLPLIPCGTHLTTKGGKPLPSPISQATPDCQLQGKKSTILNMGWYPTGNGLINCLVKEVLITKKQAQLTYPEYFWGWTSLPHCKWGAKEATKCGLKWGIWVQLQLGQGEVAVELTQSNRLWPVISYLVDALRHALRHELCSSEWQARQEGGRREEGVGKKEKEAHELILQKEVWLSLPAQEQVGRPYRKFFCGFPHIVSVHKQYINCPDMNYHKMREL